jgi:hypothetical protein
MDPNFSKPAVFKDQQGDPAASPPSGLLLVYSKGGKLYVKDSGGTVSQLGGGLSNVVETLSTASPNDVVNALQLEVQGGSTNVDLVLTPKGAGAFIVGAVSGTTPPKRGARAVDFSYAGGSTQTGALGDYSFCTGYQAQAPGYGAVALGGAAALGANSLAHGGGGAGGYRAVALGSRNAAVADCSSVPGGDYGYAKLYGSRVLGHQNPGNYGSGAGQIVEFVGGQQSSGTTPVELVLSYASARMSVPSGSVYHLMVNISGAKVGGATAAAYMRQVVIQNVSGTTSLLSAPVTIGIDLVNGTSIAISADDANDSLKIEVTGIAEETWRWTGACYGTETSIA